MAKKKIDILIDYFNEEIERLGLEYGFDYDLKNKKEVDLYLQGKYKYKKVLETIKE